MYWFANKLFWNILCLNRWKTIGQVCFWIEIILLKDNRTTLFLNWNVLICSMCLNILFWNHCKTIGQVCFWDEMYWFNVFKHFVMKALKNNRTSLFLICTGLICLLFLNILLWNHWKTIGQDCFCAEMYWFAQCFWTFCYEIIEKQ